ncbi:Alpha/Beta hydrolase protein [Mycena rebaudengoi]|nr:Alpha/Beta hydrolase protein [Mycena rebaudengoi]
MSLALAFTTVGIMGTLVRVLLGRSRRKNTLHFSNNPAVVAVSRPDGNSSSESLQTLVETRCPSLLSGFSPAWWLFNGHLQTLYCVLGDFSKHDRLQYNRKLLRLSDGGTIGLDFAGASDIGDDRPILVVLHGLTGGSYESYVRAILVPACKPVKEGGLGYRAVVVNFRGCAGVPITSPQLYSAGHTGDIRDALIYISAIYPKAPLMGLGFSLGANVLTRYLAEEGENSRLSSGCALACPWDLAKNNHGLRSTFMGNIYSKAMATNLVNLVRRNFEGLSKYTNHQLALALPLVLAFKNKHLEDFDDTFTRIVGGSPPDFPFASAQDYYKWGSSHNVLKNIRVPYLAINSADDPIVQHVPMDGDGNPVVIMALTPSGGHLGWFQGESVFTVKRWIIKPVLEWSRLIGEGLVQPPSGRGSRISRDANGVYRAEGEEGGCEEVEGGGLIDAHSWQSVGL